MQTNPLILKTPACSPANGARDWLDQSNIIAMCRSKVLKFRMPEITFKACLQKALTFLTERVFSRELRQYAYGRNPVVQCQRFGISKPDYYCRCNGDAICSCSFNFNITFFNAYLRLLPSPRPSFNRSIYRPVILCSCAQKRLLRKLEETQKRNRGLT